jgi:ABC-type transport system involved in cytochrome c biogenesis permease subunit
MVFAAWACILAGIILSRHSLLPLICAGILAGCLLLAAHIPSIDSSFTPLPPVLKSKLMITHVSIAITGYGFFSVGTALALCNLLVLTLLSFLKENNLGKRVLIWSKITEQALWIGLFLIILGSMLGSIWANEAWGRYWGWDPKESWTLILILSYAIVLNLRLVIRTHWNYWLNIWSLFAFGTLIMTYFGVNRFFSGMHTYGGQKGIQFTLILFWVIGIWIVLSFLAYRNREIIKE